MLPQTKKILDILSSHELFLKYDIRFVGGTALSYLIDHRLSEDLDFAALELPREEIDKMMISFGAKKISHNLTAVDYALNDGEDLEESHLKYIADGVKVEFFVPPFNIFETKIWKEETTIPYPNSHLKIGSLKTILYMKTMAFWNRKKYRDLFDIYFALKNIKEFNTKTFLELYLQFNITYTKKSLLEKIQSKNDFYEKNNDEGISGLVKNFKPYDWYRKQIENFIYEEYLKELY